MYLEYWELQVRPFDNTPDPKFFYFSQEHEDAFLRLTYAVKENKGAFMLTGEYGCGKTTLIRTFLQECFDAGNFEVAFLNNPVWDNVSVDFFRDILFEFGEDDSKDYNRSELFRLIGDVLMQNVNDGKVNLLVVDEAQLIEHDKIFEDIRLLLNYQLDDINLITILIIGQPELREKVLKFPQLEQRISLKYHLHTLNQTEVKEYIHHRLNVAGCKREIFTDDAFDEIYKRSFGTPRRINNICDLALFIGFQKKLEKIDSKVVASTV